MNPAERTGVFGVGLVFLNEAAKNTNIAQPRFTESFAEPTTVVDVPFWSDNLWQVHSGYQNNASFDFLAIPMSVPLSTPPQMLIGASSLLAYIFYFNYKLPSGTQ